MKFSAASGIVAGTGHDTLASVRSFRPQIPTLDNLASVTIRHTFGDLFNLPLAMNDLGFAQSVKSVSAITAIAIPPFALLRISRDYLESGFSDDMRDYG